MARRGENIHKRKDGRWEGRYIKARTPEGKIQWGYVYGAVYAEVKRVLIQKKAEELGADVEVFQSNHEGAIIDKIQEAYYNDVDGIVINPGAFTHYSYAVRDALASVAAIPKIEVHISNVHTREEFRHTSVTVPVCNGQVVGLGLKGYLYAMEAVVDLAMKK